MNLKSERGVSLLKLLVYIIISGITILVCGNLVKLVTSFYIEANSLRFYDEIDTINKYIDKVTELPHHCTVGETQLIIESEDIRLELSSTTKGVMLTLDSSEDVPTTIHLDYVRDFSITKLDKIVLVGNDGTSNLKYTIPSTDLFEVFYNPTPPSNSKQTWLREVITYEFK